MFSNNSKFRPEQEAREAREASGQVYSYEFGITEALHDVTKELIGYIYEVKWKDPSIAGERKEILYLSYQYDNPLDREFHDRKAEERYTDYIRNVGRIMQRNGVDTGSGNPANKAERDFKGDGALSPRSRLLGDRAKQAAVQKDSGTSLIL